MNDRPDLGPDEGPDDERDQGPVEEALWRAIVANYGDRPQLEAEAPTGVDVPVLKAPEGSPTDLDVPDEPEEHFVPPPAPPVPRPEGARLAAWLGVLGVPVLMLVKVLLIWALPSVVGLLLTCWFVGGFAYLVANMKKGPPDDWSGDGAVI